MSVPAAPLTRLSRNPLWDAQRAYFEDQGPRAWSDGAVPHYVTSNPFIAQAYAEVILGFARDRGAGHGQPLYIIELGAGCGRLGYTLARALHAAGPRFGIRPVYVVTDFAERTVAWWHAHAWLQPLFHAGALDIARYDIEHDRGLELRISGQKISADQPLDQMIVIANYVFDSLPHDVFYCASGALFECLTTAEQSPGEVARDGFRDPALRYVRRPADADRYYDDPVHNAILDDYRRVVAGGAVSLPIAALVALDHLRALCRGPMMVLSADKGSVHLDGVVAAGEPGVAVHGSVSMAVNYHAIGAWVTARGGRWIHAGHHHRTIDICAMLFGTDDDTELIAAYDRAIVQRGPDDFYTLKSALERSYHTLAIGELLAYLRLSGHDAKLFLDYLPTLLAHLPTATAAERRDLATAIPRIWDGYFPIGEPHNLPLGLGQLALGLGRSADARALFAAAIELHGETEPLRSLLAEATQAPEATSVPAAAT